MRPCPVRTFAAPWSRTLTFTSWGISILCLCASVLLVWQAPGIPRWIGGIPLGLLLIGPFFTVRQYTVARGELLIRRLCWTTRLPLTGLQSARFEPDAMKSSLRLFGNGGLFSFTGYFRNRTLGTYRAFVTDPKASVVLRFSDRTVVVSPAAPEEFVRALEEVGLTQEG